MNANVSNQASDFFETDAEIEKRLAKDKKSKEVENLGEPIKITSKVLNMTLVRGENPKYAYVAESGFLIRKINLESGKTVKLFKGHTGPVTCVEIIYNSQGEDEFILTGSWDKTIKKWDVKTKEIVKEYTVHTDFIKCIAYEPIHNTFISGSSDKTIRHVEVDSGNQIKYLTEHTRAVEDICFEDYTYTTFYTCSSDSTIKKWNLETGECLYTFAGHLTSVYKILCDVEENNLWSVSADKTVRRWDLDTLKNDLTIDQEDFVKTCIKVGGNIITGSRDDKIRIYDISTGKLIKVVDFHFDEVTSLFNIKSIVFSGSLDCTVKRFDLLDNTSKFITEVKVVENQPKTKAKTKKKTPKPTPTGDDLFTAEELAELEELMNDD
ncbi:WD40 repeat-like protein [Anaeromyces robustus]|uniref:WD40 repeat-like protein n=1 Tax=Anaeromyces robustus TaxID=1754192 RepID=A0A1Y1XJH2_9FUNG|nr:WD40 repeat-like protein [Anaeromyces robustus]|eukprot:ORX85907.1 WD40 repeat-like protein [Anaeromyces robustus]